MNRHRVAVFVAALLLFSPAALAFQAAPAPAAVNVTGTWTGTFTMQRDGQTKEDSALIVLKQTGETVTGTAGPNADRQKSIEKGKIVTVKNVTTLTFQLPEDETPITFELKLVDGRLKGTAKGVDNGQPVSAEVNVGRAK